jgi:molybdenum cofactor cytidylyltransferase
MFGEFRFDTKMQPEIAVVILAAGYSSRMGTHKALLKYDDSYNFIQKIVSVYILAGLRNIVVVVNRDNADVISASLQAEEFGEVIFVLNEHPEWERFYSIKCGLAEVVAFENCFIHNCDNPFVNVDVISKLLDGYSANAVTVPEFESRRGHPILLPRKIIQSVLCYTENSCNFKSFLSDFQIKTISVDSNCILININTKDDLI